MKWDEMFTKWDIMFTKMGQEMHKVGHLLLTCPIEFAILIAK